MLIPGKLKSNFKEKYSNLHYKSNSKCIMCEVYILNKKMCESKKISIYDLLFPYPHNILVPNCQSLPWHLPLHSICNLADLFANLIWPINITSAGIGLSSLGSEKNKKERNSTN